MKCFQINVKSIKYTVFFLNKQATTAFIEVPNGLVVRAGILETWNVLSWSGGHEFEPQLSRTWGA